MLKIIGQTMIIIGIIVLVIAIIKHNEIVGIVAAGCFAVSITCFWFRSKLRWAKNLGND